MLEGEEIVMTPAKEGKKTQIRCEKVHKQKISTDEVHHKGGGAHKGLTVAKQHKGWDSTPAHLQLEFKCWLLDSKTGDRIPENRGLKFWFREDTAYMDKVTGAYEFFKELVTPDHFPRDYTSFIMRVMKQLQRPAYAQMIKVNCELTPLDKTEMPDESFNKVDNRTEEEKVQEHLLLTLESAFPNSLHVDDLVRMANTTENLVMQMLYDMKDRNLVKDMGEGKVWMRFVETQTANHEVKMMKQNQPILLNANQQPTIAIITALYCEKQAVDAMIEDKTTFVKYKTEGESNVYTLGWVGQHRVISTKLPQIGRTAAAQISSGNNTTRLLGTFGQVEHVFLVGCGGGVPHFADYYKHCRLGDVVVSVPNQLNNFYFYCDRIMEDRETGELSYTVKKWGPKDPCVQAVIQQLREQNLNNPDYMPWQEYIQDGLGRLEAEGASYTRPAPESDRLYMNIGGDDVIEVAHPPIPEGSTVAVREGVPVIRYGQVGSGKPLMKHDQLRHSFSDKEQVIAFDTEFNQVMDSIEGNRKDSCILIRGVADYLDGSKNKEWQPYSALAAAAFMKAVICSMPPQEG